MRHDSTYLLLLLLVHLPFFALSQIEDIEIAQKIGAPENQLFQKISIDDREDVDLTKEVENFSIYKLNPSAKEYLQDQQSSRIEWNLEAPDGQIWQMSLDRFQLRSEGFQLKNSQKKVVSESGTRIHYTGEIKGNPNSMVVLSLLENEVTGMISIDGRDYFLGQLKRNAEYILYEHNQLLKDFPDPCHVSKEHLLPGAKLEGSAESSSSNPDNCVKMYFEVTHDIYLDKGGITETLDYIEGALAQVKILYNNEDINWEVNEILVWDTPDPYDGPNSGDYLVQFRNELDGNYNGDLAHLLGYGGGGGVAYLDVLCNSYWGVAYSGIGSSYNDVPEYSWTIMVIAHEIGHNIGSPHTHACNWNGNNTAIDGCGPEAGYSEGCDAPLPAEGTVMSYCHLIGGVGIDLGEGFHPQVQSLMQDEVYNASCLSPCFPNPVAEFDAVETILCEETEVVFYELSVGNITDWNWSFPGGNPASSTDLFPSVTYNSAGTYDVTLEITDENGVTDELTKADFITVGAAGSGVKIYQDFEGGLGNYTIQNNGGPGFEITTAEGSTYGDQALWIDNFNNSNGSIDELISPEFSLLGHTSATLYLDYAYCRKNGNSDSLIVQVSTDGGASYEFLTGYYETGNGSYETAPNISQAFQPADSSEWCLYGTGNSCLAIDLSGYSQEHELKIKIINKSLGGNNLFIDRLWVETDCYDLDPPTADFSANMLEGCAPMTVQFQDESTQFPISHDWIFDGGSPSSSTEENPTVTYDQPGEYDVTLTVSNPEGADTEFKFEYIVVNDRPTSDFEFSIDERTVDFSHTGSEGETFDWEFGDGNSSTEENPVHTYAEDGEYEVTLSVMNDCGADDTTIVIEIATLPNAQIDISPVSGCQPLSVFFDASDTENADEVSWQLTGASPENSVEDTLTAIYNDAGIYDVLFIATNENGSDSIFLENYLEVNPLAVADFIHTVDGLEVEFFDMSSNANEYYWDFGDGNSSTVNSPVHTYDDIGTYNVSLIVSNDCGNDTLEEEITVMVPPIAEFSGSPVFGCATLGVEFQNQSQYYDSLEWTFEGGVPQTSNATNPYIYYENEGVFDVKLVLWNDQYTDSFILNDYIGVEGLPQAGFDYSANGRTVSFENLSSNHASSDWDFGDGSTSMENAPSHTYAEDGEYTVTLTVENDCGVDTVTMLLQITSAPTATFSFSPAEGCSPLEVEFTNESSSNSTDFIWIFEGGNPDTSYVFEPTVIYDQAGTYNVTLIAIGNGGTDTFFLQSAIEVLPDPIPSFSYSVNGRDVNFTNQSQFAQEYIWDFGDGNTSSDNSPVHSYSKDSVFEVYLTALNDCDTLTSSQEIQISTPPNAMFEADTAVGCTPLVIQFQDQSSANTEEWQWTFPGGVPQSSDLQHPTVTYDEPGMYDVQLISISQGGADTIIFTEYIEVRLDPEALFSFSRDSLTITFENQSLFADQYVWDFGDGETSMDSFPIHSYPPDSTFLVTLYAINQCDTHTFIREVSTLGVPVADFSLQGSTVRCVGDTVQFIDQSTGQVDNWEWNFEGGSPAQSTDQNPKVVYSEPGTYSVTLITSNSEGSNQLNRQNLIEVNSPPLIDLSVDTFSMMQYRFEALAVKGAPLSYYWILEGDTVSTASRLDYTFPEAGEYDIQVVVLNSCGAKNEFLTLVIETNSTRPGLQNDLIIYPNPARDRFTMEGVPPDSKIRILNALGKEMLQKTNNSPKVDIRSSSWPSGNYWIELTSKDGIQYFPIVLIY